MIGQVCWEPNKPIIERPKAELDSQGWLSEEQSNNFRKELEKSIVMDNQNNTISFYLPVLPEGFEWDTRLNTTYGTKIEDRVVLADNDSRIADGKTYTFNIKYNELTKGYFTFGPCKRGLVADDRTILILTTGNFEYRERAW